MSPDAPDGGVAGAAAAAVTAFDLTTEPWVPVLWQDGSVSEVSLSTLFSRAGEMRRIVGDLPTQEFALLRLALAILHDALEGGPATEDDWSALWEDRAGLPDELIARYLRAHRDRFDLLHPETPFMQVADLRTAKGEVFSLDRIVADVPNGERFFTMRAHGAARLGFAEAARWLVHAQAFDPSGIKSGAVGDDRVKAGRVYPLGTGWAGALGGVFAEGGDLRETLLLNLIAADTTGLATHKDDRPAWRHSPPGPGPLDALDMAERPRGPRDLYTWQARRVRLHWDAGGVHGVVLAYGDPLPARNMHGREPMTAWRRSEFQEKKHGLPEVYLPRQHDPAVGAWRGVGALVAGKARGGEQRREAPAIVRPRVLGWLARLAEEGLLPEEYRLRTRLVGAAYGTQQAVFDEIVDDSVSMAVTLLLHRADGLGAVAVRALDGAEDGVRALGGLAIDLAEASSSAQEIRDAERDTARDLGFGSMDAPFRVWLEALAPGADPEECLAVWRRRAHLILRDIGDRLVDQAGTAAWDGRVVDSKNGAVWLSASRAQLRFHRDLDRALPRGEQAEKSRHLTSSTPEPTEGP